MTRSVVEQPGRLPGGLSRRRGWLLLLRTKARSWKYPFGIVLAYAAAVAWAYGLAATLLLIVIVGVMGLVSLLHRPGIRVTTENQPALAGLVADVAAVVGGRPDVRIWLTSTPQISAQVSWWRCDLHLGLPLLACLSHLEVRALVGHELSVLSHARPWLVAQLVEQWEHATAGVHYADGELDRRDARVSAALAPFARDVHRGADAAALLAGGSAEVAARAYAVTGAAD
ncbi:MAG: hypothetical protein L0Y54_01970, partial [Sporichthyaceae bacterium]|nr:hypothetical protein [Sporichthyaceae bacterium]